MILKQKWLITLRPCGVVEGVMASRVIPRVALEAVDVVAGWKKKSIFAVLSDEKMSICTVAKRKKILLYSCYIKKKKIFST
jgi:hypothetical protein